MTKNIIKKKTPGGQVVAHKTKKSASSSHCRICGISLRTNKKTKTKSGKRVARPLSAELCPACLKSSIQMIEL